MAGFVDQLNPIGVNDAEHRWGGQEGGRPVLMGLQEAKEARALGEAGEQGAIVTRQPAREGAVAHAFEGMEEPQGDHLTGPEVGLRMFGDGGEMVIDLAKEGRDTLDGVEGRRPCCLATVEFRPALPAPDK